MKVLLTGLLAFICFNAFAKEFPLAVIRNDLEPTKEFYFLIETDSNNDILKLHKDEKEGR